MKGCCAVLAKSARYWQKRSALPPQPLKPRRIGRRVADGMLNIPMSQIILNEPRICALIRQGKAAGVTQHVRVCFNRQACALAIGADRQPYGLAAERRAPFADKEYVRIGLHLGPHRQPGLDRPQFVATQRLCGG